VTLQEKRVPRLLAGIAAAVILMAVFIGYSYLYRSLGFPLWMRWLAPVADAEPLPGRPEVQINTKLNADWTIVGMNSQASYCASFKSLKVEDLLGRV
jgi:hypothetical protein